MKGGNELSVSTLLCVAAPRSQSLLTMVSTGRRPQSCRAPGLLLPGQELQICTKPCWCFPAETLPVPSTQLQHRWLHSPSPLGLLPAPRPRHNPGTMGTSTASCPAGLQLHEAARKKRLLFMLCLNGVKLLSKLNYYIYYNAINLQHPLRFCLWHLVLGLQRTSAVVKCSYREGGDGSSEDASPRGAGVGCIINLLTWWHWVVVSTRARS